MNSYQVRKGREFKIVGVLGIAFTIFNMWLHLSEFYNVSILQKTSGYPFGGEGPTPWYYHSAQMYTTYKLSMGMLFLAATIFMFWGLYKNNRPVVFMTFALNAILFLVQLWA